MYHSRQSRISCGFANSGSTRAEAKLDDAALAGAALEPVVERRLGPGQLRIDGRSSVEDVVGDPVLGVGRVGSDAEDSPGVRLVLAEERFRSAAHREPPTAEIV